MAKSKTSRGLSDRTSDIILVIITALVLFIVAYPLYYVLIASFSNPYDVYAGKTFLLPSQPSLDGYKAVFADPNILTGYGNSIKYTIIGTVFSGWLSDVAFKGNRYIPAVAAGVLEVLSLILFAFGGNSAWVNILAMVLFGIAIGVLICFLGGLMAVDIVPREAAGAALGVVGIASYAAAGLQDIASGLLIDGNKTLVSVTDGVEQYTYNFTLALIFWIVAATLSVMLVCVVWRKATTNYKQ